MIVLDSLFPIFTLILLGNLLFRYGLTNKTFLDTSDRLVYYIFFPLMLFWKISGASTDGIDWNFCLAALSAVIVMFVLSTLAIQMFRIPAFKAGSFSQSCYRFNTYIGMAVIMNSLGEEGIKHFGILIGLAIPMINVFAVTLLIWYSGREISFRKRTTFVLRALIANPLILGCITGILYSRTLHTFPVFIENSLELISMVTLPMALISIGGALTFKGMQEHLTISLLASGLKLLVLPLVGYLFLTLFKVTGIPFKVGMIFFTLPASTAIYVLSSQLNSDTELASASIVLSTVLSFLSLSIALLL